MLIMELKEILRDLDDRFLNILFQKHQVKIMNLSEDKNHDIDLNLYFKFFTSSFCMHVICICNIFHI